MWALNNQTPFAAERCWVRDKNGAEVWLVAVKGTFKIGDDGNLMIAENQEEVVMAPQFLGDPQSSSLVYDTDLPHKKAATDVLLFGHAYAPSGEPTTGVTVGLRLGPIHKDLRVTGDRLWVELSDGGVALSRPQPFERMPIAYERAYGGMDLKSDDPKQHDWDVRNPAGCGFATEAKHLAGMPAPNIEDPNNLIGDWRDRPQPVGYGPVAGHWQPRVGYVGTYDETWEKTRQPLLPTDFDERYYQCAPEDQQVPGYLKGGETVELFNLTPGGYLKFRLPRVSLAFTTQFFDGSSEQHRAALHSVVIRADGPTVAMIWHTHLEYHHKGLKLKQTVIRLKPRLFQREQNGANVAAA